MNAMLTWWGVSIAILNHHTLGNPVIDRSTLLKVVPIFVAVMVWLIRVLIIGTFSVAGERLFSQADRRISRSPRRAMSPSRPINRPRPAAAATFRSAPKPTAAPSMPPISRPEPTYHPAQLGARPANKPRDPRL